MCYSLLQQALRRLLRGWTSFVTAYRLSTIREADVVGVMHQGLIAEQGTHDTLHGSQWRGDTAAD